MPNKKAKQKKWDKVRRQKENKQRKRDQKNRQTVMRQRAEYAEEFIKDHELWAEYMNFLPPEINFK